ncbi:twin-arginine translocation signal domain-containing protein [Candidatus Omnitrophota bacterium]
MSSNRREFIKEAAVMGAVVSTGVTSNLKDVAAETATGENPQDITERCPYFDQPLLCKGIAENGKFMCDE